MILLVGSPPPRGWVAALWRPPEGLGGADARQNKFWVQGTPDGERWEIYTVLEDSPTFWGRDGGESWAVAAASLDTSASTASSSAGAAQCCGAEEGASESTSPGACCA